MRKLLLSLLAIMLIPSVVFAAKTGVRPSLFSGAPAFHDGPEYDSTLIYQQEYTGQLRIENEKDFYKNMNEATRMLQKQTDENAKLLAGVVEKGNLKQLEEKLRKQAEATGDQVSITNNDEEWVAEYVMKTEYGIRTDTATVWHKYAKVRIITKVQPFGVLVFSIAQVKK